MCTFCLFGQSKTKKKPSQTNFYPYLQSITLNTCLNISLWFADKWGISLRTPDYCFDNSRTFRTHDFAVIVTQMPWVCDPVSCANTECLWDARGLNQTTNWTVGCMKMNCSWLPYLTQRWCCEQDHMRKKGKLEMDTLTVKLCRYSPQVLLSLQTFISECCCLTDTNTMHTPLLKHVCTPECHISTCACYLWSVRWW